MAAERTIGNYVLGPVLGHGGMSTVHAATHRFLGDRVAIKLLRDHLAGDPGATAAFLAEATRTRAIDHPHVVRVLDFGRDGDELYLVMELLDGDSLATRLERGGPLDEASARELGAAIADGVAAAHERGIVHRDLKPGNIMLAADLAAGPKIVDFGIARHLGRAATAVTGTRVGTIAYMAPEQIAGGLVAPCIDIWALGVLLFEAVTGRLPFEDFANGRTPQLVEPAPRLRALAPVSAALEALVAACLERDPAGRPPSMRAVAEALRAPAASQRFTEELMPGVAGAHVGAQGAEVRETEDLPRPGAPVAAQRGDREHGSRDLPATKSADPTRDVAGATPVNGRRPRGRIVALIAALMVIAAVGVGLSLQLREDAAPLTLPGSAGTAVASGGMPPAPGTPPAVSTTPAISTTPTAGAPGSTPTAGAPGPTPTAGTPAPGTTSTPGPTPTAGTPAPGTTSTPGPTPTSTTPTSTTPPGAANAAQALVTVEIRSDPAGAAVTVGGKRLGVTPATLALAVPTAILVTRAGYRPARVRAEHAGPLDVRLVPAQHRRPRPVAGETLD